MLLRRRLRSLLLLTVVELLRRHTSNRHHENRGPPARPLGVFFISFLGQSNAIPVKSWHATGPLGLFHGLGGGTLLLLACFRSFLDVFCWVAFSVWGEDSLCVLLRCPNSLLYLPKLLTRIWLWGSKLLAAFARLLSVALSESGDELGTRGTPELPRLVLAFAKTPGRR